MHHLSLDKKCREWAYSRLLEDRSYTIDRDKLTNYEYIWVLSTTGRDITTERAWGILFEATKEVCQAKDADDYGQGYTFSVKINLNPFFMVKWLDSPKTGG